ncbi:MAG: hypothetical protein WCZ18_06620 [Ottowia sp.]|nr:hypothetical protein [Ottowia sp.]
MKKYIGKKWALAFALTLLAPLPALAAGSATIANGDDVSQLSWQDTQRIRVDLPGDEGYMVLRDGKTYMVSARPESGMPPVMEVGDMMRGMVDAFGDMADADESASPLSQHIESIKKTGATETVAGIKGDVYDAVIADDKGKTTSTQLVLTNDPLAAEMTDAYFAFTASMIGAERIAPFRDALPRKQRGLLRVGDEMVVQAISKDKPAADAFELPAEPVNFGDMMQQMMKQMTEQMQQQGQ